MFVIGVDPSPRKTGVAKLELRSPLNGDQPRISKVLGCAVVESVTGTEILDVVATVHEQLLEFLADEEVPVYIEVPIGGRNPGTLIQQGFLIGGISSLLYLDGIKPRVVHPMHVKALLGIPPTPKGEQGSKEPVIKAIRERVGDPQFLKELTNSKDREALCDAIGIALAGVFMEDEE